MDRALLKGKSKAFLKKFLVQAVVVCLIYSIFSSDYTINLHKPSISGINHMRGYGRMMSNHNGMMYNDDFPFDNDDFPFDNDDFPFDNDDFPFDNDISDDSYELNINNDSNDRYTINGYKFLSKNSIIYNATYFIGQLTGNLFEFLVKFIGSAFIFIIAIISIVIKLLIGNPIKIGTKRFFLNGYRNDDANISDMFTTFTDGHWVGYTVKLIYLDIILLLWTLLFIIPGIYKSIQYVYVPYLISDNPQMSIKEAMAISKEMTEGKKFEIFVLGLSFILWHILSTILLGLGFLLLVPYIEGTYAALYLQEIDNDVIINDDIIYE